MFFYVLLVLKIFVTVFGDDGNTSNNGTAVLYDAYFGKPVTAKRSNYLDGVVNGTILCTVLVRPCQNNEGRRVDGTCTNPQYPSRGARLTPFPRILPPQYGPGNMLRPAKDGSELPSTRVIRTTLIGDGFFRDHYFSTLATHFHVFSAADNVELFYLLRYLPVSNCCPGNRVPNRANPQCIPIIVPSDDPYLQSSGIQCLNLTRVETYQDYGCLPTTLPAERYSRTTPLLDLSLVYGSNEVRGREIRADEGGLLAFMMEGDREVPAGISPWCIGNTPPEVSCYNYGENYNANLLPGIYLTSLWFFREHNRIARRLNDLNPCWDDEKLYQTARQINIAQYQYIYYYELIPYIMGPKKALDEGIIYETTGYVDDFNPEYEPGVYREFIVGLRWFHTYQEGSLDLYRNGTYRSSRPVPDDSLRTGVLAINNTEADLTQGSYIQPSARFDHIVDYQLTHRYAPRNAAADLVATDMMRGRDAGFQSYNHYRKVCGMKYAKRWEDFYDTIDKDKVEQLRRLYDDEIDDVELMVAIYIENWMPGSFIGPTLYCIMVKNLLLWRKSDKFFFEHGDHPTALTIPQLTEIRRTSMSRILCDSGDKVNWIQPQSFFRITSWNQPMPCNQIPGINLHKWTDHRCANKTNNNNQLSETIPILDYL